MKKSNTTDLNFTFFYKGLPEYNPHAFAIIIVLFISLIDKEKEQFYDWKKFSEVVKLTFTLTLIIEVI